MTRCLSWLAVLSLLALSACGSEELIVARRGQPIVGGTPANDGFLPAVGALVAYGNLGYGGTQVMSFCTGTLISDRLVLSAAHCVEAIGKEIPAGIPIGFFTGSNSGSSSAHTKVLPFKSWRAHPSYKGGNPPGELSDWYDIAILELQSPTTITPMKMIRPSESAGLIRYGVNLLIVGYGLTNPSNQYSSGAKFYGDTALYQAGSSELWIMGKNGAQKCNGDSGGPTLEEASPGSKDYRVIGVASRAGEGCVYGSVETRVDAYLKWIHSQGTIPCGSGLSVDCDAPPPPPKRKLGESCTESADCDGQLCIPLQGGSVCSQLCVPGTSSCPTGYGCVPITGRSDGACVKQTPAPAKAQGEACAANSECAGGLCADADGTRLCTQPCTVEAGCGDDSMACVPDSAGALACAPKASAAASASGSTSSGCAFATSPRPDVTAFLAALALLGFALLARRR